MLKPLSPERHLSFMALLSLGACVLTAFVNWLIDPLQFYRRASYPPEFSDQTRYQNPGLARNYPYDTVIVGTSVSRGFDIAQIHKALGGDALNLSMQGASAREQSLMLEVALRSGRVHRVLWDINSEFLRGPSDWVSDFEGAFPAYFYNTRRLDKLPNYLLNIDTTKDSLRVLLRSCGLKLYPPRKVSDLSGLDPRAKAAGRDVILQKWRRQLANSSIFRTASDRFTPALLEASFDDNFLRIMHAHPEVEFELWFPPFSTAYYTLVRTHSPAVFESMLACKKHVLEQVREMPNVRLYDFQGDLEISSHLDSYFDMVHFDAPIYGLIVQSLAEGRYRATPESLTATENLLRRECTPERIEQLP